MQEYTLGIAPRLRELFCFMPVKNQIFFYQGNWFCPSEKLGKEHIGTLVPNIDGSLIGIKPLFRPSEKREHKQADSDIVQCNIFNRKRAAYLDEVLEMRTCAPLDFFAKRAGLHHHDKARIDFKVDISSVDGRSNLDVGG